MSEASDWFRDWGDRVRASRKARPLYEISVVVERYNTERRDEILDAVDEQFIHGISDFDNLDYEPSCDDSGEGSDAKLYINEQEITLAAGCSVEQTAQKLHQAIWRSNGAFCVVHVGMRSLDAPPPFYTGTMEAYDEFIA